MSTRAPRIAIACLLLAGACFGQTTTLSGTSSGTLITQGNISFVDGSGGVYLRSGPIEWRPQETRKPDGRGPTIAQIRNAAHRITPRELAPVSYATLAKELGMEASTDEAQVLQVISDAGLPVYDFAKVDGYLYRQALKQGADMRWVWRPARDKDAKAIIASGQSWRSSATLGLVSTATYRQSVPYRVLSEMKLLAEAIPGALFLISDFEALKPDPFLAVTTDSLLSAGKIWIVSQWDEPGFGEGSQGVLAKR